jgi:hypothetical protein
MRSLILTLLLTSPAFASGLVTIEGTGYGKTEKELKIEAKNQIFTIKKVDLTAPQRKFLEDLKWGAPVSITIPLSSVAHVADAPKKSE